MKIESAERIIKAIPGIFKNVLQYTKENFDKEGRETLDKATGTIGVLVKLFGKSLIDKYFEKQKEKKLEDFGLQTYLKAAFLQAGKSLKVIKDKIKEEVEPDVFFDIFNGSLQDQEQQFKESDVLLIFQPKYHPAVLFVKDNYLQVLREVNTSPADIKAFQKNFNDNIEAQIEVEFGVDYEPHLKETDKFRLQKNETHFLWEMKELGRIGFKESENLKYEKTFARWKRVSQFREKDFEISEEDEEKELQPIEELINEYFNHGSDNHLEKILFIIADFGKGKSVFLRQYASQLAKNYLETGEGDFPVYFNLRNFRNYSTEPKLGVMSDYLETEYGIKIDSDCFKKKKYIFLVDSLDESGELTKSSIDKVISSIKSIQGIEKTKYRTNRIIITSRPFDEGLSNHLKSHNPYIIKNKEDRDIEYFISIYGFTKNQFNDWLLETLKKVKDRAQIKTTGFAREIISSIGNQKTIDIYEELVKNETLSRSELRRPIFAYMIYQLILNNVDFSAVGKIGVYLSFLNLLTKDAKHVHDTSYKINLKEEFEFRNLLHAIAALWMYERQQGKQGALKKADICRVLDGKDKRESDAQILERYKNESVTEIQFLSHSYFGEKENILHFQHQSFAEILLAEYYLKVFIKYALDEETKVEEARTKLILGGPTVQTIQFLKEMLRLLRDSTIEEVSPNVIEKRRLLFPLMASLATEKNSSLFCNEIFNNWYDKCEIPEEQTKYPLKSLEDWCIGQGEIDKIIHLAKEILESKTNYLLTKADAKTALYNKEILAIQNNKLNNFPPDMDRWLALLVGNELFNDEENEKFFNGKIEHFEHLFDLIRNWNYAFTHSTPSWGKDLFKGIDMSNNEKRINVSHINLRWINFSYSILKNLSMEQSVLFGTNFHNVTFENFYAQNSDLRGSNFSRIKIKPGEFALELSIIEQGVFIPYSLCRYLFQKTISWGMEGLTKVQHIIELGSIHTNHGPHTCFISEKEYRPNILENLYLTLEGILIHGLQHQLFTINEIKTWFKFELEQHEKEFFQMIDGLKKYEAKKKAKKKSDK